MLVCIRIDLIPVRLLQDNLLHTHRRQAVDIGVKNPLAIDLGRFFGNGNPYQEYKSNAFFSLWHVLGRLASSHVLGASSVP
jgi:hypothetical protein